VKDVHLTRAREHIAPIITCVAAAVFGIVSLTYPFGRDQGEYAAFADAVLKGLVPYRDVVNVKPPLAAVVHAVSLVLLGRSMTSIRILDLGWTIATSLAIYAFCHRAYRRRWAGVVAGLFYSYTYYLFHFAHTAQADGWLNLPVTLAMLATVVAVEPAGRRESTRLGLGCLVAGGCVAIAMLFKYTMGLILVTCGVFLFLKIPRDSARQAVGCFISGFMIPMVLAVGLLGATSALPAFIESQFTIVPGYALVRTFRSPTVDLATMALFLLANPGRGLAGPFAVARLYTMLPSVFKRGKCIGGGEWARSSDRLVLLWLVAAFASLYAQGKFFNYHFLPLLPPLSIMAAQSLLRYLRPPWIRINNSGPRSALVILVALGLVVPTSYPARFAEAFALVTGAESLREYWKTSQFEYWELRESDSPGFSLRGQLALVDYLQGQTDPTDTLFIWGSEPLIYFLTGRRIVSRHITIYAVASAWAPEEWRRELIDELLASPPVVFIVVHKDHNPSALGHNKDSYTTFLEFPALYEFVDQYYEFEAAIDRFDIYRLRAD